MRAVVAVIALLAAPALAQTPGPPSEGVASPIAGNRIILTLMDSGAGQEFRLWGLSMHETATSAAKSRDVLDDLTSSKRVLCDYRGVEDRAIVARCRAGDVDLAAALLKSGWVVHARRETIGTVEHHDYAKAERDARDRRSGLWKAAIDEDKGFWELATGSPEGAGAIVGGSVGLLSATLAAVLALLTAWGVEVNRRDYDRRTVAAALGAELAACRNAILGYFEGVAARVRALDPMSTNYEALLAATSPLPPIVIDAYGANNSRLGLLGPDVAVKIVTAYSLLGEIALAERTAANLPTVREVNTSFPAAPRHYDTAVRTAATAIRALAQIEGSELSSIVARMEADEQRRSDATIQPEAPEGHAAAPSV